MKTDRTFVAFIYTLIYRLFVTEPKVSSPELQRQSEAHNKTKVSFQLPHGFCSQFPL